MPRATLHIMRPVLLALALPLATAACRAAPSPRPTPAEGAAPLVFVSNEGSGDLTVIDSTRDEVVATIPIGKRPRGLRLDPGGDRIYAAVSGSPRSPPGVAPESLPPADRSADGIAVVDVRSRRVVAVLPSGQDPEAFDLLPDGASLVVSNEETASASIVDLRAGLVAATVEVGEEPEGVTTAPGGAVVAVTSEREHRVDFLDPVSRRVVARVPTCLRPRSVAFTPDGAVAFASCEEGAAVQVMDARAYRPLGEITLPPGSRPMGLAMAADGARLWVSNGRAGTVSEIELAGRTVAATIPGVGTRCWGLALTPDGRKLYVANGPSNDVAVIDVASRAVVKRIPAGELPWGIAVSR